MRADPREHPASADVLAPAGLGPVLLRNRIIKSATFEHYSPHALVSDRLINFHVAVGRGGAGMTTVAYLAVSPEGRTERDQLYWRHEALPGLRRLTDAVHATGAKVSAQIGHAGYVANPRSNGARSMGPSRRLNLQSLTIDRAATAADVDRIVRTHARAAAWAVECGFDAVEVHLGHTYLLGSFLSRRFNRRRDEFGGSLARRAELPRRTLAAVRQAVGTRAAVLAKLNMDDGIRRGITPEESLPVATMLESDGNLDALELSGGSSLLNPMYLFRGDIPRREFEAAQPPLLRLGVRIFGGLMFHDYPYHPLYFLDMARQFRAALTMPLVLLGGITDRAAMDTAMAEGFQFVAMARALLREPDLVNRIAGDAGRANADGPTGPNDPPGPATTVSQCIHCNRCMPTIYSGTHCPEIPVTTRPPTF